MTPMAKRELTVKEFAAMGGRARSDKLTPEQKQKIAKKAAKARWGKKKGGEGGK